MREPTLSDVLSVVASLDRGAGAGGWKPFRSRKDDVERLRWLLRDELGTGSAARLAPAPGYAKEIGRPLISSQ